MTGYCESKQDWGLTMDGNSVLALVVLVNNLTMLLADLIKAGRNEVSDEELMAAIAKSDELGAKVTALLKQKLADFRKEQ